jgi:hypothetical protein
MLTPFNSTLLFRVTRRTTSQLLCSRTYKTRPYARSLSPLLISPHKFIHSTPIARMSAEDIITAYDVAVPEKQEQNLPGLDRKIKRES